MSIARALREATKEELRRRIVTGYPVDPKAIEGYAYRGTSLGNPRWFELLTWKTFQKTFWRHPDGRLLGWNVRLEQDGIDAPSRPKRKRGVPVIEWPYEVVAVDGSRMPRGFDRGLVIDYGRAPGAALQMRFVKDPLVSLSAENNDELIGVSYAQIDGVTIETPTYFTLERDHRIDYVPESMRR